jgi:hypothetical protein
MARKEEERIHFHTAPSQRSSSDAVATNIDAQLLKVNGKLYPNKHLIS